MLCIVKFKDIKKNYQMPLRRILYKLFLIPNIEFSPCSFTQLYALKLLRWYISCGLFSEFMGPILSLPLWLIVSVLRGVC